MEKKITNNLKVLFKHLILILIQMSQHLDIIILIILVNMITIIDIFIDVYLLLSRLLLLARSNNHTVSNCMYRSYCWQTDIIIIVNTIIIINVNMNFIVNTIVIICIIINNNNNIITKTLLVTISYTPQTFLITCFITCTDSTSSALL